MHGCKLLIEKAAGCKRRARLHIFNAFEPAASHIKFEALTLELVLALLPLMLAILT